MASVVTLRQLVSWRNQLRSSVPPVGQFSLIRNAPIAPAHVLMLLYQFEPKTDDHPRDFGVDPPAPMDHYDTLIMFTNLVYQFDKSPQAPYPVEILPGRFQYIEKPSYSQSPVSVACSCKDYFFTFWNPNNQPSFSAHAGYAMMRYIRTDNKPYNSPPYRDANGRWHGQPNPPQLPGVCKHIVVAAEDLQQQKFLVP